MTQEEKQLLLKDLCARLPYGVKILDTPAKLCGELFLINTIDSIQYETETDVYEQTIYNIKPYLRPMSSMTKEEKKEYESFFSIGEYSCGGSLYGTEYEYIADSPDDISQSICLFDWLNAHHFDYRGLIEEGLALEAPEEMYKTEQI